MKNSVLYLLTLSLLLTMVWACGEDASAPATAGDMSHAKGQSAVVDEDSEPHILNIAANSPDHTTLAAAVVAASLEDVLTNPGPLTVFAPNNAAFDKLPAGTVENLLKPENKATLARIIKHHATPGTFTADNTRDGQQMYMATGHYIPLHKDGDAMRIGEANILGSVKASNGMVHVIDQVLLPAD
jgi:uncharacterized surface protein with fasciclin (FAS1) repeats